MIIYMLRHGSTDWNKLRLLQGQTDVPLNQEGIASAIECGKELEKIEFTRIYTSPLQRAYKTAELIRGNREIPLIVDKRIQEISFGEIEGADMNSMVDPKMKENYHQFFYEPHKYQALRGGESMESLIDRADQFLAEITKKEDKDATILIVAHGAVIKALQMHPLGRELKNIWEGGVPDNCTACVMEYKDSKYTLISQGGCMKY